MTEPGAARAPASLLDARSRPLHSLRLSVTDRCNLRCAYCMPEARYTWLPRPELLTFEELSWVVDRFQAVGLRKLRLTGGEPLLRQDLPGLVSMLSAKRLEELALTTNGILLPAQAAALKRAGLQRVTVSLDTLSPQRFRALTRREAHAEVLAGIDAALAEGFPLKLDTVLMQGVNDDEVVPLLQFAARLGVELRFIEYMDVGGATRWRREDVVSRAQVLAALESAYGEPPRPAGPRGSATAERFVLPSGQVFGIIASTTRPFCGACDRARLTADGQLLTCLYARRGVDLRAAVRRGDAGEVEALLRRTWESRLDRGAEDRLAMEERRQPLATVEELVEQPLLEMHRRGG